MEKQVTKTETNSISIDLQLKGLYVSEFWVKISDDFIKADRDTPGGFKNYTFEITCVNSAGIPDNLVNIQVIVKVFLDTEKKMQLGFLSLSNMFFVDGLKRFADEKAKTYSLPEQDETTLISISLSHARAILLTKCAGTFLQNALLPILDPKAFVRKSSK